MYFKSRLNNNKKGVSPLIATVLLIAFAVSLGAVVINLGVNLFGNPCSGVKLEILSVDGNARVCHIVASKTLSMTVVNSGSGEIDGFKLTIVGDDAANDDIAEAVGVLEKKVISYAIPTLKRVDVITLIPFYLKQGQIKYCSDEKRDYTNIPTC
jgi:flagellin-like protein